MRDALFPVCQAFIQGKKDGRAVEIHASLSNKASRRYQALSGPLLDHMHLFLSSLRCWTPAEAAAAPWNTIVRYTIAGTDVVPPGSGGEVIRLDVDERGETRGICATRKTHAAAFRLAATDADEMYLNVSLVETVPGRRCIHKGAMFSNAHVEKQKDFVYKSKFRWKYHMVVQWIGPEIEALANKSTDADLVFRQPPSCHLTVVCDDVTQGIDDVNYLADSLLCKLTDLLPTEYRQRVALQSIVERPSAAASEGDESAAAGTEMETDAP